MTPSSHLWQARRISSDVSGQRGGGGREDNASWKASLCPRSFAGQLFVLSRVASVVVLLALEVIAGQTLSLAGGALAIAPPRTPVAVVVIVSYSSPCSLTL